MGIETRETEPNESSIHSGDAQPTEHAKKVQIRTPAPLPRAGDRLTGAQLEAEIDGAPGQSTAGAGEQQKGNEPAGAESDALRVQNAGSDQDTSLDSDIGRGDRTHVRTEAVVHQNPD